MAPEKCTEHSSVISHSLWVKWSTTCVILNSAKPSRYYLESTDVLKCNQVFEPYKIEGEL